MRGARCLLVVGLAALGLPSVASAARHDRAQTRLYLAAIYSYDRALVTHAHETKASVKAFASGIEGRCGHVVKLPARRLHHLKQTTDLTQEIWGTLNVELMRSRRSLALRFIARVAPMRWHSHAVTRAVKGAIASFKDALDRPAPHVCEDLRQWAASGYSSLPRGTRAFMRESNAARRRVIRTALSLKVLSRYITPVDKRLQEKIRKLQSSLIDVWGWLIGLSGRVEAAVGLL